MNKFEVICDGKCIAIAKLTSAGQTRFLQNNLALFQNDVLTNLQPRNTHVRTAVGLIRRTKWERFLLSYFVIKLNGRGRTFPLSKWRYGNV